ncbi:MAG: glycosyltransferase family 2 protein, partial [Armatimonadetes bacterium]|nr:glycosyltransferase family 2 protein [Armatimonadota bacterium]
YGANQKTCYRAALARGADIVVLLHPDYQYDPTRIGALVAPIARGEADAMMGSRLADGRARAGGMPRYKVFANRFLTWIENRALGTRFTELHSGLRAYSRRLLESVPFERNAPGFVFDTQVVFQLHQLGFRMGEIPVPARYADDASSVGLRQGVRYGLGTLGVVLAYWIHRRGIARCPLFEPAEHPPVALAAARGESVDASDG